MWIRSSTGHLCIDLTPPETNDQVLGAVACGPTASGTSLFTPLSESEQITSISLRDYHEICDQYLGHGHLLSVSPHVSVKLGSIRCSSGPEYEGSLEVASSDCGTYDRDWGTMDPIVEGHIHP
jgi:hypothetical protein